MLILQLNEHTRIFYYSLRNIKAEYPGPPWAGVKANTKLLSPLFQHVSSDCNLKR